ncbi:MAG: GntR family transcriptional regulator [Variibacter sp.]|nr:GntR family transcriptional regulator [Variibacter sp.]
MSLEQTYRVPKREPIWRGVYRNLRLAILNRDIAADTRLIEVDLAQALGVSRTPLREALARLEADGLIGASKGGGYVVTDPREELSDAYHFRAAIEGYGARLAAERVTRQEIKALRDNVEANRTIDLADVKGRAELNADFHHILANASRSPRIIRAFENIRDFIMTDEDMRLHTEEACRQFVHEHDLIVSALEMRDGSMADRIMRVHLRRAVRLLQGEPDGTPEADDERMA